MIIPKFYLPVLFQSSLCRSAEARTHASLGYVYELLQNIDLAIDHYELVRFIDCFN